MRNYTIELRLLHFTVRTIKDPQSALCMPLIIIVIIHVNPTIAGTEPHSSPDSVLCLDWRARVGHSLAIWITQTFCPPRWPLHRHRRRTRSPLVALGRYTTTVVSPSPCPPTSKVAFCARIKRVSWNRTLNSLGYSPVACLNAPMASTRSTAKQSPVSSCIYGEPIGGDKGYMW